MTMLDEPMVDGSDSAMPDAVRAFLGRVDPAAIDAATLFPKTDGLGARRDTENRIRVATWWLGLGETLLFPGERLIYVTSGRVTAAKKVFGTRQERVNTMIAMTDHRILLAVIGKSRQATVIHQIPYGEIDKVANASVTSVRLTLKLRDKRRLSFDGIPVKDWRRVKPLVQPRVDNVLRSGEDFPHHTSLDPLCMHCHSALRLNQPSCEECGHAINWESVRLPKAVRVGAGLLAVYVIVKVLGALVAGGSQGPAPSPGYSSPQGFRFTDGAHWTTTTTNEMEHDAVLGPEYDRILVGRDLGFEEPDAAIGFRKTMVGHALKDLRRPMRELANVRTALARSDALDVAQLAESEMVRGPIMDLTNRYAVAATTLAEAYDAVPTVARDSLSERLEPDVVDEAVAEVRSILAPGRPVIEAEAALAVAVESVWTYLCEHWGEWRVIDGVVHFDDDVLAGVFDALVDRASACQHASDEALRARASGPLVTE